MRFRCSCASPGSAYALREKAAAEFFDVSVSLFRKWRCLRGSPPFVPDRTSRYFSAKRRSLRHTALKPVTASGTNIVVERISM